MKLASVTFNSCNVIWEKPSDIISLSDTVDIWRVQVSPNLQFISKFESLLQPDELRLASRFYQFKDRERFIIRRGALRMLLSKYLSLPATNIQFVMDDNKKPLIKKTGNANLSYNVSHSGDWVLIALAKSPLGVDLEQIDPSFNYHEVLNQSFSPLEINSIEQSQDPGKLFFQLWTRKEALTKATSKGLDDDFIAIPCLNGVHQVNTDLLGSEKNWLVTSFEIDESHPGSIACVPGQALRFFDFSMSEKSGRPESPKV